ncbi:MAG: YfiR family protein [Terriglobales bacterium]
MTTSHQRRERSWRIGTVRCLRWLRPILLLFLSLPIASRAQTRKPTEFEVKAAYLFNFAKFVKWPGSAESGDDTFPICVLGGDPFGPVLDSTTAGEKINDKRVTVRRIGSAADAANCRILFVSTSERPRLVSVMAALSHLPILTVSDIDGFVDRQGIIEFVMDRDRVRFQVNLSAAERAGLTLSSELLKVATSVKREGQSGD